MRRRDRGWNGMNGRRTGDGVEERKGNEREGWGRGREGDRERKGETKREMCATAESTRMRHTTWEI